MTSPKKIVLSLSALFICALVVLTACRKDEGDDDDDNGIMGELNIDSLMFALANEQSGFTWYKNSDVILESSSFTGHQEDSLRTRYNTTASAFLDNNGKVISGTIFPEGSLIVKELYHNNTTVSTYAIMYKKPGHINANADGWVWGYLDIAGNVKIPASDMGIQCVGCHNQNGSIDFTLMNKAYP